MAQHATAFRLRPARRMRIRMPAPRPDPVQSDDKLPERSEVVVIGGGIIGSSTALALAEKGIDVTLCEKGRIGAEQSGRNWGWCRTQGRDPREIALSLEANRMWTGLNAKVQGETGFRNDGGVIYLCSTDKEVAKYEAWLEEAKNYQVDCRMLSSAEVKQLLPGATQSWKGGIFSPSAGRAEPQKAAPAIANGARLFGAKVFTNCAVRGIETSGGRISGVVTEKGRIAASSVVLAGGAWSRLFCGNHKIDFPQLKVRGSVFRTSPVDGLNLPSVAGKGFSFRKRVDGGYTVANRGASVAEIVPDSFRLFFKYSAARRSMEGDIKLRLGERFFTELMTPRRWKLDGRTPFEDVRILDPSPDTKLLQQAKATLADTFPA
ncbi:MAG: FAD-binding oxidoreductase, partial [Hyphomicrobiaceae bacterium]